MLSRVAENLYWLGRYIERAENTARLINVNTHLLLDLPKGLSPGWEPLIEITGSGASYRQRYGDFDERSVVGFLLADRENAGSIISSLSLAREDARSIRDIVPREIWEQINELFYFAKENVQSGIGKRGRYDYLKHIIVAAQTVTGMQVGIMNHDAGYEFLRAGRLLERADMTSRIVDVRSATLLPDASSELRPFENIQWISVLKSLSGYQMYRRKVQARVRHADTLQFLLQDDEFPRAFYRSVSEAEASVVRLPRNEGPLRALGRIKRTVRGTDVRAFSHAELRRFIDHLQIGLGQVHDEIARTYFLPQAPAVESSPAA